MNVSSILCSCAGVIALISSTAHTKSVRFVSGNFGYTVFTHARGAEDVDAGVEVLDRRSGKRSTILCSERPRFYIWDLQGIVPCDPETPVGTACVK